MKPLLNQQLTVLQIFKNLYYNITSIISSLNLPFHSLPTKRKDALTSFSLHHHLPNLHLLFLRSNTMPLSFPLGKVFPSLSVSDSLSLLSFFRGFHICKRWTFTTKQCSSLSTCSCKGISWNKQEGCLQYLCPSLTLSYSLILHLSLITLPPIMSSFSSRFLGLSFSLSTLFLPCLYCSLPLLLCWLNTNCLFLLTQSILSI